MSESVEREEVANVKRDAIDSSQPFLPDLCRCSSPIDQYLTGRMQPKQNIIIQGVRMTEMIISLCYSLSRLARPSAKTRGEISFSFLVLSLASDRHACRIAVLFGVKSQLALERVKKGTLVLCEKRKKKHMANN